MAGVSASVVGNVERGRVCTVAYASKVIETIKGITTMTITECPPGYPSLRAYVETECNRRHRVNLEQHVTALRAIGKSWNTIGEDLGVSGQTVANWFAK